MCHLNRYEFFCFIFQMKVNIGKNQKKMIYQSSRQRDFNEETESRQRKLNYITLLKAVAKSKSFHHGRAQIVNFNDPSFEPIHNFKIFVFTDLAFQIPLPPLGSKQEDYGSINGRQKSRFCLINWEETKTGNLRLIFDGNLS